MKVWGLAFDGRGRKRLEAVTKGDTSSLEIDSSRLKSATPFFKVVAE